MNLKAISVRARLLPCNVHWIPANAMSSAVSAICVTEVGTA